MENEQDKKSDVLGAMFLFAWLLISLPSDIGLLYWMHKRACPEPLLIVAFLFSLAIILMGGWLALLLADYWVTIEANKPSNADKAASSDKSTTPPKGNWKD